MKHYVQGENEMLPFSYKQPLADTILMVRPYDFGFNEETGLDNEFQCQPVGMTEAQVNAAAMREFSTMVANLQNLGVNVLVLERSNHTWIKTPDAVFPNNWFSTEPSGTVVVYPMFAENRRAEKRVEDIEELFLTNGYEVRNILNIGRMNEREAILEGTGSMVIDHESGVVYAAESRRCHPRQFHNFVQARHYTEGILFRTQSSNGRPIYHTNVMMSIGKGYVVICADCIEEDDRERVLSRLSENHEIITISMEQMEQHFCGNILQVRNSLGERLIVMSRRAYEGFGPEKREDLGRFGTLVPVDIDTIEQIGGGSARCMMAEIFLPRVALPQAQIAV